MREEFSHHLEARTDDLVHGGLSRAEATRQARAEFGHENSVRMDARAAMGLTPIAQLRFSWLDLRWALRTLRKHPVLNLAVIFALAVGIPIGLAPSHLARALESALPGDPEHRIRAIRHWDPLASTVASTTLDDLLRWEQSLRSYSTLGAFRSANFNVDGIEGRAETVPGAQVTADVFPMLDARPQLGRLFDARDFDAGSPNVVVIGYGLWSAHFARDPQVVGRNLRAGGALYTVVGVMPDGFAFPSYEVLWLPLRRPTAGSADAQARVQVIARLADGITVEHAQAELASRAPAPETSALGVREAETRARLRPEVVPFGFLFIGLPATGLDSGPEFRFVQLLMYLLLLVACGNVAMLVFARTATRLRELAIRSALGASRARIVAQIFLETFVLAVVAAGVGLLAVHWVLTKVNLAAIAGEAALPYWLSLGITWETALTALVLAVLSATVAGVVPAVTITGRAIAQHMGASSRVRFGRLTGALIVADIAVSVAAVGMAFAVAGHATDAESLRLATGVPAERYLAVEMRLPEAGAAESQRTLVAALASQPEVLAVAISDALPRMEHRSRPFEVDRSEGGDEQRLNWTRVVRVDVHYLAALEAAVLQGRDFTEADSDGSTPVAIVNTAFVTRWLGEGDPLGRRVRFPTEGGSGESPWFRIVGVVGPLGSNIVNAERGEAVYLPAAAGSITPLQVGIRTAVPPLGFASRMRELALGVNPDIVIGGSAALSDVRQGDWYLVMGVAVGLLVLAAVLVAMATSGLYAMLSLAVTERTREIGIRAALGAPRWALLLSILRRPLTQIAIGAALGLPLALRFVYELTVVPTGGGSVVLATAIALGLSLGIVMVVGLTSCLVPMRRILAVEASEAMRAEA